MKLKLAIILIVASLITLVGCERADIIEEALKSYDYSTIAELKEIMFESDYDFIGTFSEGLALVRRDSKFGFVNEEMELIIPLMFDFAEYFHGGVAVVSIDGKWGAIDTTGQITVPLIYDFIRIGFSYNEGLAWFIRDGKLGYVHRDGREIVPPIYDFSFHNCGSSMNQSSFSEGLAMVERNGRFGFIDSTGTEAIPLIYDFVRPFRGGLAQVSKNDEPFVIDREGNIVYEGIRVEYL